MTNGAAEPPELEEPDRISTILYWPEVAVILEGEEGPPGGIVPWHEVLPRAGQIVFEADLLGGTGTLKVTRVGLFIWDITRSPYGPTTEHVEMHTDAGWGWMRRGLSYWENLVLLYSVLRLFIHKHARGTASARATRWTTVSADDFVAASDTMPVAGLTGDATALAKRKFDLYTIGPAQVPMPSIRELLEVSVIETAVRELGEELARPESRSRLHVFRLHHDACAIYVAKNFTGSLVTGFPAVEALIEDWWNDIDRGKTDADLDQLVGQPLRDKLRSAQGRYTGPGIGLHAELLRASGAMTQALYDLLEMARQARNDWIHDMKPVPYAAAEAGMDALAYLIEQQLGPTVPTAGGFQY